MKNKNGIRKAINAIGAVFCVVFAILLLFNLTIIVKGLIDPTVPPSVFGLTPLVVKSGSMSSDVQHIVYADEIADMTEEQKAGIKAGDTFYTRAGDLKVENKVVGANSVGTEEAFFITERPVKDHIEVGDLIIVKKIDPAELKAGDVISFIENSSVVTHRVIRVNNENGALSFLTKGDANNTEDSDPVPAEKVVGRHRARIPMLGDFIYFLQKPLGMVIFIGVPVLTFILYDIIRRSRAANKKEDRTEELEKELQRLRALAAEQSAKPESDDNADI